LSLSGSCFAIRYPNPGNSGRSSRKISERWIFFVSAFAKRLPPSRKAPADKTARQAQNGAKILVTNSDDARFVTEARDRGIMSPKKDAASELAGRRASNV
jgi:hypothetical protein